MAIAKTGAIYKALTFDGSSSRNYGIYITGEAVYNAPERAVEMVTIPGRNGAFAIDQGRFENIEVTYPAGIFADTEADFAAGISDFRNYLCSRSGYCRLTDEYNPDEYRLAIYKSGLEVEPAQLRAGQFNITFECMPQRFLTSGETAVAVSNLDTITNPTRFEASPLLEINSSTGGMLSFNSKTALTLTNSPLGRVVLAERTEQEINIYFKEIDSALLNSGDEIQIEKLTAAVIFSSEKQLSTATKTNETGDAETKSEVSNNKYNIYSSITFEDVSFNYGTAAQYYREFDIAVTAADGTTGTEHVEYILNYNGAVTFTVMPNVSADAVFVFIASAAINATDIIGISSVMALSKTIYVNCEYGNAYIISNDKRYQINQNITFGSKLPVLKPGSNSVYFTGFTSLKITPNWWKV